MPGHKTLTESVGLRYKRTSVEYWFFSLTLGDGFP